MAGDAGHALGVNPASVCRLFGNIPVDPSVAQSRLDVRDRARGCIALTHGAVLTYQELGDIPFNRQAARPILRCNCLSPANWGVNPQALAVLTTHMALPSNVLSGIAVPYICFADKACMAVIVFRFCGCACLTSPAGWPAATCKAREYADCRGRSQVTGFALATSPGLLPQLYSLKVTCDTSDL